MSAISTHDAVLQALKLCAGPAAFMLVGSLVATAVSFSKNFISAMQHLGGGVVIAAVAIELMPKLIHASPGATNTIAMLLGFVVGVIAMLLLKALSHMWTEQDGEGDEANQSLLARAQSLQSGPSSESLRRRNSLTYRLTSRQSVVGLARNAASAALQFYPWTLFGAVAVDSLMDGILVGIAIVAGGKAGYMMALALAIEMGFLGVTFAIALSRVPVVPRLISIVFMPAMIIVGGVIGASGAGVLAEHEGLFVSIIAFGSAAMLYLVAEELLLEAHEDSEEEDSHVWWVDMCFFVGVLMVLLMERLT